MVRVVSPKFSTLLAVSCISMLSISAMGPAQSAHAAEIGAFCYPVSVAPGGRCVGPKRDYRFIRVDAVPDALTGSGTVCVGGKGQSDGGGPNTIPFGCIYAWQFNGGTLTYTNTGFYASGEMPRSYATIVNNSTSTSLVFGTFEYYPA